LAKESFRPGFRLQTILLLCPVHDLHAHARYSPSYLSRFARCAATRQRGEQYRAVVRFGSKGWPQWAHGYGSGIPDVPFLQKTPPTSMYGTISSMPAAARRFSVSVARRLRWARLLASAA
jgi:hypothetical protein